MKGCRNPDQSTRRAGRRKGTCARGTMLVMPKISKAQPPAAPARVRRGYFECRFGQLHVHHSMPPGGGFEEGAPLLCVADCVGSARPLAFVSRWGAIGPSTPRIFRASGSPIARSLPDGGRHAAALGTLSTPGLRRSMSWHPRRRADCRKLRWRAAHRSAARWCRCRCRRRTQGRRHERAAGGAALAAAALAPPGAQRLARLTHKLLVVRPRDEPAEATGVSARCCSRRGYWTSRRKLVGARRRGWRGRDFCAVEHGVFDSSHIYRAAQVGRTVATLFRR